MVGSFGIFGPDDDSWLLPWVRVNVELCQVHNWEELREQMRELPWVGFLHEKPAQAIFDAANLMHVGL